MGRFFANDSCFRQQAGELFAQDCLGLVVGNGDDIVRCLGVDLMCGQALLARQDCPLCGLAHDGVDRFGKGLAQLR